MNNVLDTYFRCAELWNHFPQREHQNEIKKDQPYEPEPEKQTLFSEEIPSLKGRIDTETSGMTHLVGVNRTYQFPKYRKPLDEKTFSLSPLPDSRTISAIAYISHLPARPFLIGNDRYYRFRETLQDSNRQPVRITENDFTVPIQFTQMSSSPVLGRRLNLELPSSLFENVVEGGKICFQANGKPVELTCEQRQSSQSIPMNFEDVFQSMKKAASQPFRIGPNPFGLSQNIPDTYYTLPINSRVLAIQKEGSFLFNSTGTQNLDSETFNRLLAKYPLDQKRFEELNITVYTIPENNQFILLLELPGMNTLDNVSLVIDKNLVLILAIRPSLFPENNQPPLVPGTTPYYRYRAQTYFFENSQIIPQTMTLQKGIVKIEGVYSPLSEIREL